MVLLGTTAEEEESSLPRRDKRTVGPTEENQIGGWVGQDGERRKSYSAAVIGGIKRNSRIYVGDSIVRKTDTRLTKGEDVVVCLPGARIEHAAERVEQIMGRGNGGSILVHIGTNNADKEGTTAIVEKYRNLLKKTKQARVGQIILSGILPVFRNRIQLDTEIRSGWQFNGMVKRLCKEEEVGYVDLWDSFVGKGCRFCRGTVGWQLPVAWVSLMGQGGLSKKAQKVQADSGCKGIQGNASKAEIKCVCLNA